MQSDEKIKSDRKLLHKARFAFGGPLADILAEFLLRDSKHWHLPWKFRFYYWLRPLIPLKLRHQLQQRRNCSLDINENWFLPKDFQEKWIGKLEALRSMSEPKKVIHPWPDGRTHAALLTHDVETKEGLQRVDKLAALEEESGFRSAWFFIPAKYRLDKGLLKDLQQRGHEVGVHGYNHDGQLFSSYRTFFNRAAKINASMCDWQARGFRSPMMHRQLDWMQSLDAAYDASCFDIDPFQAMPGGVGSVWPFIYGRLVELPCTLPQDHTLFVTLKQDSLDCWRKKYDWIRRFRGMAMCIVHPDYLDSPRRWELYQGLMEIYNQAEGAWNCLPVDAAAWWKDRDQSSVCGDLVKGAAAGRGRAISLDALFCELTNKVL